jgi:hypothetical protein
MIFNITMLMLQNVADKCEAKVHACIADFQVQTAVEVD